MNCNLFYWYIVCISEYRSDKCSISNAYCFTPPQKCGGVIFSLQFDCVCESVWQWTKFQPNGYTDLDTDFANLLLNTLTQTLLKFVTLGLRSRSQWHYIHFYTSTKSWRGYIFTPICLCVCVCVCVCLFVCVSGTSCEQNSSRTDEPIWTRFLLNGCFLHWLGPYWYWWPWVKGQGHSDVIPIFFFIILY